jgi:hypothetical protein
VGNAKVVVGGAVLTDMLVSGAAEAPVVGGQLGKEGEAVSVASFRKMMTVSFIELPLRLRARAS